MRTTQVAFIFNKIRHGSGNTAHPVDSPGAEPAVFNGSNQKLLGFRAQRRQLVGSICGNEHVAANAPARSTTAGSQHTRGHGRRGLSRPLREEFVGSRTPHVNSHVESIKERP